MSYFTIDQPKLISKKKTKENQNDTHIPSSSLVVCHIMMFIINITHVIKYDIFYKKEGIYYHLIIPQHMFYNITIEQTYDVYQGSDSEDALKKLCI